jgi:hypothetical protein
MKKLFFLFAMLASVAASAQVTHVEPAGANYTNKTVTFRVWWNAGSRDATHFSKVWVWVDYIKINSNNTTSGNTWTRAEVNTVSGGVTSYDGNNRKGFWLEGNASTNYSATLTVQLTNVPDQFNWCAYASDCPPNAMVSNGTYTLRGSSPFVVNGTSLPAGATQYAGNITALTDATGAPGAFCTPAGQAPGKYGCCSGLSVNTSNGLCAMPTFCDPSSTLDLGVVSFTQGSEITITGSSYTQIWSRPVTATGCQKGTFNGGSAGSVKSDCRTNPGYAGDLFSWCAVEKYAAQVCPFPWRIPMPDDFCRLHKAVTGANCVEAANVAWITAYQTNWAMVFMGDCSQNGTITESGISAVYLVNGYTGGTHSRFSVAITTGYISLGPAANNCAGRTLQCVRD